MEQHNIIRMLIVIISGAAIYFGYKLFYLVTERQGKLLMEGKDARIGPIDVCPGLLFALIGVIVLILALRTQPYIERANSEESVGEIALSNLCIDDEHKDLFEEGLKILSTLEVFHKNKKSGPISDRDKESILEFVKKGKFDEMLSLSQTISSYKDSYIFMVSYLQYFYLHHPCN